jgi:hypothetical protein
MAVGNAVQKSNVHSGLEPDLEVQGAGSATSHNVQPEQMETHISELARYVRKST